MTAQARRGPRHRLRASSPGPRDQNSHFPTRSTFSLLLVSFLSSIVVTIFSGFFFKNPSLQIWTAALSQPSTKPHLSWKAQKGGERTEAVPVGVGPRRLNPIVGKVAGRSRKGRESRLGELLPRDKGAGQSGAGAGPGFVRLKQQRLAPASGRGKNHSASLR